MISFQFLHWLIASINYLFSSYFRSKYFDFFSSFIFFISALEMINSFCLGRIYYKSFNRLSSSLLLWDNFVKEERLLCFLSTLDYAFLALAVTDLAHGRMRSVSFFIFFFIFESSWFWYKEFLISSFNLL